MIEVSPLTLQQIQDREVTTYQEILDYPSESGAEFLENYNPKNLPFKHQMGIYEIKSLAYWNAFLYFDEDTKRVVAVHSQVLSLKRAQELMDEYAKTHVMIADLPF